MGNTPLDLDNPYDFLHMLRKPLAVRIQLVNPNPPRCDEYLMKAVQDLQFQSMLRTPIERYMDDLMHRQLAGYGLAGSPLRTVQNSMLRLAPDATMRWAENNPTFLSYTKKLNTVQGDLMSTKLGIAYSNNKEAVWLIGSALAIAGGVTAFATQRGSGLFKPINDKEFKILDGGHLKLDAAPRFDPSNSGGGSKVHAAYELMGWQSEFAVDFNFQKGKLDSLSTDFSLAYDLTPRTNLKLSNANDYFDGTYNVGLDLKQKIGAKSTLTAGVSADVNGFKGSDPLNLKAVLGFEKGKFGASLAYQQKDPNAPFQVTAKFKF